MKRTGTCVFFAVLAVLSLGAYQKASAQSDAVRAMYQSSASIPTNISGVHTFPAPPAEFTPLTASDAELAAYGFPPRPDQKARPDDYAKWTKAMTLARNRWNGQLKPRPEFSTGLMRPVPGGTAKLAPSTSGAPTLVGSYNWSGIANTFPIKKWNSLLSVSSVLADFNVPVAQQAFSASGSGNVCDGFFDVVSVWDGIDGINAAEVLQGGATSYYYCNASTPQDNGAGYTAWVEWYPSYPELDVFPVNPGDDIYVDTYAVSGACNPGFVFVEDETLQEFGTFELDWLTGPCLVGNSSEIIVERPAGDPYTPLSLYPLANYVMDFTISEGSNNNGNVALPGSQAPATWQITMFDDTGTIPISSPLAIGTISVVFEDEGCAAVGGCTP